MTNQFKKAYDKIKSIERLQKTLPTMQYIGINALINLKSHGTNIYGHSKVLRMLKECKRGAILMDYDLFHTITKEFPKWAYLEPSKDKKTYFGYNSPISGLPF